MKKRKTIILIATTATIATLSFLHSHGFKIYGYPHMYRSAPPQNEGWIQVQEMKKDHLVLEGGEKLPLYPFHLTTKGLALSTNELARQLFDLSSDDIYVRKRNNQWIVRAGNRYISSHQSFFPKREYGYYEDELLDSISGSEINVTLGEGLIGAESEEAVNNYYQTRVFQEIELK